MKVLYLSVFALVIYTYCNCVETAPPPATNTRSTRTSNTNPFWAARGKRHLCINNCEYELLSDGKEHVIPNNDGIEHNVMESDEPKSIVMDGWNSNGKLKTFSSILSPYFLMSYPNSMHRWKVDHSIDENDYGNQINNWTPSDIALAYSLIHKPIKKDASDKVVVDSSVPFWAARG